MDNGEDIYIWETQTDIQITHENTNKTHKKITLCYMSNIYEHKNKNIHTIKITRVAFCIMVDRYMRMVTVGEHSDCFKTMSP